MHNTTFAIGIILTCAAATSNVRAAADTNMTVKIQETKEEHMKIIEHASGAWNPGLSEEEKSAIFAIAAQTLEWCVGEKDGKFPSGKFPMDRFKITPKLKIDTATFVTLKIKGELRGCIGSLAPSEPLYLSVHHNAINAAMHDYRFSPVGKAELPLLEVDVSILSPIREIPSPDDFKLGQQGIILEKDRRRAVFLPEVAIEQKWTKEQTLTHLALKAGLEPDAWRKGARFYVFESVVLSSGK